MTKYGCCAALSTKVFFDLKKGRKLFSTTAEHVTVVVPNTSVVFTRYIAFHSIEASLPPLDDKQVPDLSGVIQYVSNSNVLQRIAVISKNQNAASITLRYQGKQNEGRTLMLWGFDKKNSISSLSDFSIVVSYGSAGEIVLSVRDDKIDLKNATYTKFFQLKSIQE